LIEKIRLNSQKKYELIDITEQVQKIASTIDSGAIALFAPHATGSIVICENEPGLKEDVIEFVKNLFEKKGYKHDRIDDNAHAHLISSFLGCSRVVPIEKGRLMLGTWQSIFFLESDGSRERTVYAKVLK
jgi:secondary thiamine-phosphate synthase enzyme